MSDTIQREEMVECIRIAIAPFLGSGSISEVSGAIRDAIGANRRTPVEITADEMRSFIIGCLPFLEEAWEACFHGEKQKMLSAEERGMGMLLSQFREIAKGERVLPLDCVTRKEASEMADNATSWAQRMLGNPNELNEDIRAYIGLGQTCAHGIKKAHAEIVALRAEVARLKDHAAAENAEVLRLGHELHEANHRPRDGESRAPIKITDEMVERALKHEHPGWWHEGVATIPRLREDPDGLYQRESRAMAKLLTVALNGATP